MDSIDNDLPEISDFNTGKISAFERLSDKHKLFVEAYIENMGNGTRAYQSVYPRAAYDSARNNSARLLANDSIKMAIQEEFEKVFKDRNNDFRRSETYLEVEAISHSKISDVVDIDGDELRIKPFEEMSEAALRTIKSITVNRKIGKESEEVTHSVTLHDKIKGLEIKAKLQNMLKDTPVEVDIVILPAVRRPDQMRKPDIEVVQEN